jgi:glycerate dehydrogenase
MKIVAVDAYGVNPGDLDWAPFRALGEFVPVSRFTPEVFRKAARDAEAILVDHVAFDAERLDALPDLKYLGLFSTGYDRVDVRAAAERGIAVTNVPEYSTMSVAQLTIALLLSLAQQVPYYNEWVHRGGWVRGTPMEYASPAMMELAGKTIAILGFGAIGSAVGRMARAFDMNVISWNRRKKYVPHLEVHWLPWETLLERADVISLHLPLTNDTRGIIDSRALSLMKPTACLINTARGGLVDEQALARALEAGTIAGAAVDVLGFEEPPERDHPLLHAPRCIITPHIGWATREARQRCLREAAENLRSFSTGGVRNRIDTGYGTTTLL